MAVLALAVCADASLARRAADEVFARYAGLDNYHMLLVREGVSSLGAVAIVGTEADIEKQIGRLSDVGVTELSAISRQPSWTSQRDDPPATS